MTAPLAPEMIYRIVTDYEGVQDAFADRIEDINVPLTEVDAVAGMTRGNMQKLLVKSDAKWAREFGWKTLGDALKGTGMVLAFILDDEKFAPIKAQMTRRKSNSPRNLGQIRMKWLLTPKKASKLRKTWWASLSDAQKKRIQRKAQKGQAAARRRARKDREQAARKSAQQVTA
jgi:hypothetical protein